MAERQPGGGAELAQLKHLDDQRGGRISQLKIGATVTANYSYDGRDRLSVRQTLNMTPAGTTQYLYDQWDHLVAETNGAGTVVKQYVWVGDMPVAVLDGTSTPATPTVLYVHADHLNRPEMMTNATQAVVWKAVYEPFGAVVSITGTASNTGRFPGQWYQLEAGLNYNWHRYYDPSLGRYTTPDPLGAKRAGPSVFGYAGQSPLMRSYGCGIHQIQSIVNQAGRPLHGSEVRLTRFVGCLVFWKVG